MPGIKMNRHAKGKRPAFFPDEPAADRLLSIVMALATEVAVLRERLDTVEGLASARGVFDADEIDAFEPTLERREARELWRQAYLDRVLRVLSDEVEEHGAPLPKW